MSKIKEWLKKIFPLPARTAEQRLKSLESSLESISDGQKGLNAKLERLQDPKVLTLINSLVEEAEKGRAERAEIIEHMQGLEHQIDFCRETLGELRGGVREIVSGDIFRRIEFTQSKLICLEEMLQQELQSVQEQQKCREMLDELRGGVKEIVTGDIFRRIEFTQYKLIWLEELLQQNMLSMQEQQDSDEYRFITRMRAQFPLSRVESNKPFARFGRHNDGGYVMLDDFEGRSVAYSIGIADDVSWDRDIAARGLDVYMYDHTIDGLPEENERFHFSRIGIGTAADAYDLHFKTLPEMMVDNGNQETYGMILKMDVEGAEWEVLQELDEGILKHFSQIVFEFHDLTNRKNESKICLAMEKLNKTHQLVHLHANNYGTYRLLGGEVLPELLEGTYLLREEYKFSKNPESASTEFDETNCPYLADIYLGKWIV